MKTKRQHIWALPLVLLLSIFIFSHCEKDTAETNTASLQDAEMLKKKEKCPSPEFDVRGTGASKEEAKSNMEEAALKVCYNLCRNSTCTDGRCSLDKVSISKHNKGKTPDGEYEHTGVAKCKCDCQDCEDEKSVALSAFTATAPSKSDAEALAIASAEAYCMTVECPLYPCKDGEENCQFDKAKTSAATFSGEEGGFTASVRLLSCDCNCAEGVPPDGSN